MLAARLVCLRALPGSSLRSSVAQISPIVRNSSLKTKQWLLQPYQGYSSRVRTGIRQRKPGQEVKEAAFEPSMETAFKIHQAGRWIMAGGAAVGLGALCYYGLGMSNKIGALEKAVI